MTGLTSCLLSSSQPSTVPYNKSDLESSPYLPLDSLSMNVAVLDLNCFIFSLIKEEKQQCIKSLFKAADAGWLYKYV